MLRFLLTFRGTSDVDKKVNLFTQAGRTASVASSAPSQTQHEFTTEAELCLRRGVAGARVVLGHQHTYSVGRLEPGAYQSVSSVRGQVVRTLGFRVILREGVGP